MTIQLIIELILTGILAGTAAGFLGIGGGAVLTPLCLLIYPSMGIDGENIIKIIFGTNMFLVMVFSISAALKHYGNKKIDWRTVLIMGPLAVIGSLTGGWAASRSEGASLKTAFAVLLTVSSILIILRGSTKPSKTTMDRKVLITMRLLPLLGLITGFAGAYLGIGGGVIMIPSLILLFAFPIDRVAATSSSVIIFIGCAGMISYMWNGWGAVDMPGWSTGYVWWSAAIPLMIGGVPMARVGAWLNAKIHSKILQRIFGAALLVLAIKIFFF